MVGERDELEALFEADPPRAQRVDGEPVHDRAVIADGLAHALERLEVEASPVLKRASVLVCAPVAQWREELEQQHAVPAVDIDQVKADVAGTTGR
jgi:hypothetical protein